MKNLPALIGLYSPAPGSGKSTIASILQDHHGYAILPLASPIKTMAGTFLEGLGVSDMRSYQYRFRDKEAIIPEAGVSARHIMQTLGTEWGRQCIHPEVWLRAWEAQYRQHSPTTPIVVDDIRFRNEAQFLERLGATLWGVCRPGTERESTHSSEGDLDTYTGFDARIVNKGSIDDLKAMLRRRLEAPAGVAA